MPPSLEASYDNVYKVPKLYARWCRRVSAWKLRVRHYKPLAEATLDLVDAISADGALMLERVPLEDLYVPNGIEKVVKMMSAFDEAAIHSTGDILEAWETIRRQEGVNLSKFLGQFLDLESQCSLKGLVVQTGEARAYKFLRACSLLPDHQRQLLVESRGYEFDRLVSAMKMQWPKAVPPVARGRGDHGSSPKHPGKPSGGKGGKGKWRPPGSHASNASTPARVLEAVAETDPYEEAWPDDVCQTDLRRERRGRIL